MSAQQQVGSDRKYKGQSYQEWLLSLKPGDAVRVRHPWEDKHVPGGRMDAGTVHETNDGKNAHWRVSVRYLNSRTNEIEQVAFTEHGGASYRHVEHPLLESIYNPDDLPNQGTEFMTGRECEELDACDLMAGAV
jgi:hypothetical protein